MDSKIKLLTFFTASHKAFFDHYFKPTFDEHLAGEFDLVVFEGLQKCKSARYFSEGWKSTVQDKLRSVYRYIEETDDEYFVFSDADIVFFKPIREQLLEELGDRDIVFQDDSHEFCSGLYICRINSRTRHLFRLWIENFEMSDQKTLNRVLPLSECNYGTLSESFFSVWRILAQPWNGKEALKLPDHPISVFHANYTSGVSRKLRLLNIISTDCGQPIRLTREQHTALIANALVSRIRGSLENLSFAAPRLYARARKGLARVRRRYAPGLAGKGNAKPMEIRKPRTRHIVFYRKDGLGSRMLQYCYVRAWADCLGIPVKIVWHRGEECGGESTTSDSILKGMDAFDLPLDEVLSEARLREILDLDEKDRIKAFPAVQNTKTWQGYQLKLSDLYEYDVLVIDRGTWLSEGIERNTYSRVGAPATREQTPTGIIPFNDVITEKASSFMAEHDFTNVLGVHVRGGDLQKRFLKNRHTDRCVAFKFVSHARYLEAALKLASDYDKILVCAEEREVIDDFRSAFGSKVIVYEKTIREDSEREISNRETRENIIDAAVEIILLSKCEFILKGHSQFSEFSAIHGDVEYNLIHSDSNASNIYTLKHEKLPMVIAIDASRGGAFIRAIFESFAKRYDLVTREFSPEMSKNLGDAEIYFLPADDLDDFNVTSKAFRGVVVEESASRSARDRLGRNLLSIDPARLLRNPRSQVKQVAGFLELNTQKILPIAAEEFERLPGSEAAPRNPARSFDDGDRQVVLDTAPWKEDGPIRHMVRTLGEFGLEQYYLRKIRRQFPEPPIVIGGCSRSGTTLLREVVSALPGIYVVPNETGCFCPTAYRRHSPTYLKARFRAKQFYTEFLRDAPPSATRWCEKTPRNILFFERLNTAFRGEIRFLHIVRDGRDVVLSKNKSRHRNPIDQWETDVAAGLALDHLPNLLMIRYEDLIRNFEETAERISSFLGYPDSDDLLAWRDRTSEDAKLRWQRPLYETSIGKWRDESNLEDHEQKERLDALLSSEHALELLDELGYSTSAEPLRPQRLE